MTRTHTELTAALAAAKLTFQRTTGGVNPVACVAACREIARLRNALRNDAALHNHFAHVLTLKPRRGRAHHRAQ